MFWLFFFNPSGPQNTHKFSLVCWQSWAEHKFLRTANCQVWSLRFKVFTWLVKHAHTSTAVCVLPWTTRNCCSHDGNFTSKLWNFIGIHVKVLRFGTFQSYLLRNNCILPPQEMVAVVSWVLGDFLLMSSTAGISVSKDKHWHKECTSDKTLLIYMIKWRSLVLCPSGAILTERLKCLACKPSALLFTKTGLKTSCKYSAQAK